jgi:hypothetical protein
MREVPLSGECSATTSWLVIRIGTSSFVTTSIFMRSRARSVHWRAELVEPVWLPNRPRVHYPRLRLHEHRRTGQPFPQRTLYGASDRMAVVNRWMCASHKFHRAARISTDLARPLRPNNCGTPDRPISCKQQVPQREQQGHIIWNPEPFYPIIQEPLPDLTPLTRSKWPDE